MLSSNNFISSQASPLPPRIVSDVLLPSSVQQTATDLATTELVAQRNEDFKRIQERVKLQQELKAGEARNLQARQLSEAWAPQAAPPSRPSPIPQKTKRVSTNSWKSTSSPDVTLVEVSHEPVIMAPPKTEVPLPVYGLTLGVKRPSDPSHEGTEPPRPRPSLPRHLAEETELSAMESLVSLASNTNHEMPRKRRRRRRSGAALASTAADPVDLTKAVSGLEQRGPQIYELPNEKRKVLVGGELMTVILGVDEHSYRHFKDNKGEFRSGCGAIIPPGYKLHPSGINQYPCPVRGCDRSFRKLHSLGAHFFHSYRGNAFNDNGDGTISRIGVYKPHVTIKIAHAVVVSRDPSLVDLDTKEVYTDASSAASTSQETDVDDDASEIPLSEKASVSTQPRDISEESQGRPSRSRVTRSQSAKELPSSPKAAPAVVEKGNEDKSGDDDDVMDLEDWEIAPGKQVDKATRETSAFSSPYLTQAKPLKFADDLGFYRIELEPGRSHIWPAEEDTLRWFEVFSGKLDVTPKDSKSYRMGPGSHLVIRPGASYTVHNRRRDTAVISCYVRYDFSLS